MLPWHARRHRRRAGCGLGYMRKACVLGRTVPGEPGSAHPPSDLGVACSVPISPHAASLLGVALASGSPVTAVVPAAGVDAATEPLVRRALARAGWADADIVPADRFAESFDILSLTARTGDADCGGPIAVARWSGAV